MLTIIWRRRSLINLRTIKRGWLFLNNLSVIFLEFLKLFHFFHIIRYRYLPHNFVHDIWFCFFINLINLNLERPNHRHMALPQFIEHSVFTTNNFIIGRIPYPVRPSWHLWIERTTWVFVCRNKLNLFLLILTIFQ